MKISNGKNMLRRTISLFLLVVFIFCTTSSVTSAPLSFSKTKSFQKESSKGSDSESFMFEELDEDLDDDNVDTPVFDLFHTINLGILVEQFISVESLHPFTEVTPLHTPIFICNRILRI
jgi:hypothetical protein